MQSIIPSPLSITHIYPQMVAYQREFIYKRLINNAQSHVVYSGVELFCDGSRIQSVLDAPGVLDGEGRIV